MYRILVTGIGGNVGQGVLKNLRKLNEDFFIIGINIQAVSAGNYLCDKVIKVPYAYEDGYVDAIKEIVKNEQVDLIIPTTDFETLYLSQAKISNLVTSPYDTNAVFVDKYQTYLNFKKCDIPFAYSFLPSEFHKEPKGDYIFKPKQGRGSRGIVINPSDLSSFSDDDYMGQKYIEGKEITSAFYVTKNGDLHGVISMYRTLVNGTTDSCSVTNDHEDKIIEIIKNIIKNFKVRGSCNVQSRVASNGEIIPFEINGRISGTNSIRSHFGFDDVRYIIEEYLHNTEPSPTNIINGSAMRILTDVIYPGVLEIEDVKGQTIKPILF
ncbi:ATP-grasp domain-containing protein [Crocinitomix catalasitica]|uniref:ATP-grasp domain-containing protein n=1 Tax=Crocinitomix catalasitica TaxID=184607 RepID=UPI000489E796|nr:ATP-grasp domain-containing protein [Crocinitomix catalasitica]